MARLRQFFDDYATALTKADLRGITRAYAEQFTASTPDARKIVKNDLDFVAGLRRAANFYKNIGVDVVEIKNYLEADLGTGYWLTKVEWELLDGDLSTLVIFDNTYLVEASGDAPKIVFVIGHNEEARMREQGFIDEE